MEYNINVERISIERFLLMKMKGNGDWQQIAYENLANAIIEAACDDYIMLRLRLGSNASKSKIESSEVVRFFRSQWYERLTNVDANYLLRKLDEIAEKKREESQKILMKYENPAEEASDTALENEPEKLDEPVNRRQETELKTYGEKMRSLWE